MSFGNKNYQNLIVKVKVKFIISTSHCKLYFNIPSYYNALQKNLQCGEIAFVNVECETIDDTIRKETRFCIF